MRFLVLCLADSHTMLDVVESLRQIEHDQVILESVYTLVGEYHFLVIFNTEEPNTAAQFVIDKIQEIPGIIRTNTHMDLSAYNKSLAPQSST